MTGQALFESMYAALSMTGPSEATQFNSTQIKSTLLMPETTVGPARQLGVPRKHAGMGSSKARSAIGKSPD